MIHTRIPLEPSSSILKRRPTLAFTPMLSTQEADKSWWNTQSFNIRNSLETKFTTLGMKMGRLRQGLKGSLRIIWKRALEMQQLAIFLVATPTWATLKMTRELSTQMKDLYIKPKFQQDFEEVHTPVKLSPPTTLSTILTSLTSQRTRMNNTEIEQIKSGNTTIPIKRASMEPSPPCPNISKKAKRQNLLLKTKAFGFQISMVPAKA